MMGSGILMTKTSFELALLQLLDSESRRATGSRTKGAFKFIWVANRGEREISRSATAPERLFDGDSVAGQAPSEAF